MMVSKFMGLRPKRIHIEWFPVTLPELFQEFFPKKFPSLLDPLYVQNGYVQNGYVQNGYVQNGYVQNGYVQNV
jgi:hypothetical protein